MGIPVSITMKFFANFCGKAKGIVSIIFKSGVSLRYQTSPPKQLAELSPPEGNPCFFCSERYAISFIISLSKDLLNKRDTAPATETATAADDPIPEPIGISDFIFKLNP